jgi:hypothetical protein
MPRNLNGATSSASSSKRPKPSTKRTAQPGGINREPSIDRPLEGTGFDIPRDVSGFRIYYICYDEVGERICNEIPCPSDVAGQPATAPPPAADATGVDAARICGDKGHQQPYDTIVANDPAHARANGFRSERQSHYPKREH